MNGKLYIGQTVNTKARWSHHKSDSRSSSVNRKLVIHKAMAFHRIENFEFEVIMSAKTQDDIDDLEIIAIKQYNSRDRQTGYNVREGGQSQVPTIETNLRVSEGLKKIKVKLSKIRLNKPRPEVRRFSEAQEKEICKLYDKDLESTYSLAKKYECGTALIVKILERHNIEKRKPSQANQDQFLKNRKFSPEQEKEIIKYYQDNNLTIKDMGIKFKSATGTIRDILHRNSIEVIKWRKE